jgi:hypothetical protein
MKNDLIVTANVGRFEVFTAVTMTNTVIASVIRVTRIGEIGTTLSVTSIVPILPIIVTLMNEALSSSETPVLTRATRK